LLFSANGICPICFARTSRCAKDAPVPRGVRVVGRVLPVPILAGYTTDTFEFEFATRTGGLLNDS